MGPYNAGPNLTPVSNCAEYKKVFISAYNSNFCHKISLGYMLRMQYTKFRKKMIFQKTWYSLFNMALITPVPLTRINNADLGPAL